MITIQPGETKSINFIIDSSKRPDAASPIGGVTSKLSLVFPTGSGTGKSALAGTPTGSVSVTVVYVVAPGVSAGSPPPLAAGEVAFFVPGVASSVNANGDLLIANKQASGSVSDLKLFFRNQVVSLPQILLYCLQRGREAKRSGSQEDDRISTNARVVHLATRFA